MAVHHHTSSTQSPLAGGRSGPTCAACVAPARRPRPFQRLGPPARGDIKGGSWFRHRSMDLWVTTSLAGGTGCWKWAVVRRQGGVSYDNGDIMRFPEGMGVEALRQYGDSIPGRRYGSGGPCPEGEGSWFCPCWLGRRGGRISQTGRALAGWTRTSRRPMWSHRGLSSWSGRAACDVGVQRRAGTLSGASGTPPASGCPSRRRPAWFVGARHFSVRAPLPGRCRPWRQYGPQMRHYHRLVQMARAYCRHCRSQDVPSP
jgi:hypothetical protein